MTKMAFIVLGSGIPYLTKYIKHSEGIILIATKSGQAKPVLYKLFGGTADISIAGVMSKNPFPIKDASFLSGLNGQTVNFEIEGTTLIFSSISTMKIQIYADQNAGSNAGSVIYQDERSIETKVFQGPVSLGFKINGASITQEFNDGIFELMGF